MDNAERGQKRGEELALEHMQQEERLKKHYDLILQQALSENDEDRAEQHRKEYEKDLAKMRLRHDKEREEIGLYRDLEHFEKVEGKKHKGEIKKNEATLSEDQVKNAPGLQQSSEKEALRQKLLRELEERRARKRQQKRNRGRRL